jgi:rhamnogalacturonyl hydrolase YesR
LAVLSALVALLALVWCWLPSGLSLHGATPLRTLQAKPAWQHELRVSASAIARTWMADNPAEDLGWGWGQGVLAFGLEHAYRLTGDDAIRDYLRVYLRQHLARGLRVSWSDDTVPALAALERVLQGDVELRPLVDQVVHYSMHAPRTRSGMLLHLGRARLSVLRELLPQVWVDSLFHVVPTLLRYSRLTGDARYRDEGVHQLVLFVRALQDPDSGLVTHAYNDQPQAERVPAFEQRAFWARGNGWMLVALVDALEQLPASHPDRALLLSAARRLESALRHTQTASGLFHTLLLRSDSYLETAGSALIVCGMAQGLRLGLFPEQTRAHVERGARGLLSIVRRTGTRAEVTGTSLGTNPITLLYAWTPTADQINYGVGAWLMAADEMVQLEQKRDKPR